MHSPSTSLSTRAVTGIDAVLGSGPPGAISGVVTDGDGLPVPGVEIRLYDENLTLRTTGAVTADDGMCVGLLYPGLYYVEFSDPGGLPGEFYSSAGSLATATPLIVGDGAISDVDAVLDGSGSGPGGGAISGFVTDGAGNPLSKLLVSAFRQVDGEWRQVASTMTFFEADCELAGLEPGPYRVRFADGYEGFFTESEFYNDANTIDSADDILVEAGVITDDVAAVLRENLPGGIAGLVSDANGLGAGGIEVTVFDLAGSVVAETATNSSGGFLPADPVMVRYEDPAESFFAEWFDNAASFVAASPVALALASTVENINADLTPGETLRNTGFDLGIEAWAIDAPQGAAAAHSPIDAHGDERSGSAWLSADGAPDAVVALEQCLAIDTESLLVGGRVRIESTGDPVAAVTAVPYTDDQCGSRSPGSPVRETVINGSTSTLWSDVGATFDLAAGIRSVLLRFELHAAGAATVEAYWDPLFAFPGETTQLFADGFESGDLSMWRQQ